jgi:hypothetical protein
MQEQVTVFGLRCEEFAYKGEGPSEYAPADQPGEKLILRRMSKDGSIDIRVFAQIERTQKRHANPTIEPLHEPDSQQHGGECLLRVNGESEKR